MAGEETAPLLNGNTPEGGTEKPVDTNVEKPADNAIYNDADKAAADKAAADKAAADKAAADKTAAEQTPEEKKAAEEKAKKEADEKAKKGEGAPEKYDFQLPDGLELDTERLAKAEPIFRKLNLTNEQAQELINMEAERVLADAKKTDEYWQNLRADWRKAAETDSEIGGAGHAERLADANYALAELGTPELIKDLQTYGMSEHPEMVRVFSRMGKLMRDAGIHFGRAPANPAPASTAERIYPSK